MVLNILYVVMSDTSLCKCTAMSGVWPSLRAIISRTSAELAYTVELPDDGRKYGFLLPSSQAPRVGDEIWAALQTLALHILANIDTDR